jgi:hypothetical protein
MIATQIIRILAMDMRGAMAGPRSSNTATLLCALAVIYTPSECPLLIGGCSTVLRLFPYSGSVYRSKRLLTDGLMRMSLAIVGRD